MARRYPEVGFLDKKGKTVSQERKGISLDGGFDGDADRN